jgi:hypothetical protein
MSAPGTPAGPGEQLALSAFAPGDVVSYYGDRGRRIGRFLGVASRGRRRGLAEISLGGNLMPERRIWVAPERLTLVAAGPGGAPAD